MTVVGNFLELLVLKEFRRLNLLTVVILRCAWKLYLKKMINDKPET